MKRGIRIALLTVAAVLVAGSAVGVAAAGHGKAKAKGHVAKQLVRAGVHADVSLIRADGTTDSFSVDTGTVTTSTGTSVTLLRRDGQSVTLTLNSSSKVRGTISTGRRALVFSRGGVAFRVLAPGPASMTGAATAAPVQLAKVVHLEVTILRADGTSVARTLDRGQVTATSTTSLSVKRDDGHTVTFVVDSSTRVLGKLAVGGRAVVVSNGGTALRVLARSAG
jgi:hypothetical protein